MGSLQIEAITACCEPFAVEQSRIKADAIAVDRRDMSRRLTEIGIAVHQPAAGPFVLIDVRDGATMREHLRARGIAVRRCDTFPGLGPDRLRVAVRPAEQVAVLIEAMKEIL